MNIYTWRVTVLCQHRNFEDRFSAGHWRVPKLVSILFSWSLTWFKLTHAKSCILLPTHAKKIWATSHSTDAEIYQPFMQTSSHYDWAKIRHIHWLHKDDFSLTNPWKCQGPSLLRSAPIVYNVWNSIIGILQPRMFCRRSSSVKK